MMKFKLIIAFSVFLGIGLSACNLNNDRSQAEKDRPLVVSTSTIIADLTEQIGGEEIEHQGILKPGVDPHVYEPTPKDTVALEEADLILYNGYNLEPGLIRLINGVGSNADRFAVGEVVKPLDFEYQGSIEPDPHVWGDAENAIAMVQGIRERLIKLSPEDEAIFTTNAEALITELKQLDSWILEQIATIPETQRQLVTTHDAFQYYARAYGLEVTGTLIGISTEEQPSAQTVKNLANKIKNTQVPAIFAETTINPQLITHQLYADSLGVEGSEADSYINMLRRNTRTIVEALGGNFQEFSAEK
jgi:manganese/iron transport system substrate-binding protein